MFKINGIEIREKLYHSDTLSWYRGVQGRNNFPLLIKVLPASATREKSATIPTQVGKEFKLVKSIHSEYVAQAYSHRQLKTSQILLLEDIGGLLLSDLEIPLHTDLSVFLYLARNLVNALEDLHAHNLLVGVLTVHSIIYHVADDRLQIVDLSRATRSTESYPPGTCGDLSSEPSKAPDDLLYCSPECLTLDRNSIDFRSDLYSLGILLYYLLTGQFPLNGTTQLEVVHAHTAKIPVPAAEVVPTVPAPLSLIIDKLLEKLPEKRYQSCSALRLDIERCIDDFEHYGVITDFQIDESYRLQTAHSPLFGRESQFWELQTAFHRAKKGKRIFVGLTGVSGSGKTALVQHFKEQMYGEPHFFLSGKFDQYQQEIPYSSFIEGLKEFTRIILTSPPEKLEQWRAKLTEGLKVNGQVVVDVIPELQFIIGPQPPVPKLDPAESKARFEICLRHFIQLCSSAQEPLVFFLDDMQWADTATLNLLSLFLQDTAIHSLLIIGAYRNNEVEDNSPLAGFLEEIESSFQATSQCILLQDFDRQELQQYLEYHLPAACEDLDEIAAVCMEKTHGNPFFLQQFLRSLFQQKVIYFDPLADLWIFEKLEASQKRITENVADIILERFHELSQECKKFLQNLACSGSSFDLGTIHLLTNAVNGPSPNNPLKEAVQHGFLLEMGRTSADHPSEPKHFRFAHDQIQQAIYSQIPPPERQEQHLKIGNRLFQQCSNENLEDCIYPIVRHYNQGSSLRRTAQEQHHLAKLNYIAGKKALATTAHKAAKKYFTTAIALLGEQGWNEDTYELCFKLHLHGAESCYLSHDFTGMDQLVKTAVARVRSTLDAILFHEIEIQAFTAQNKLKQAVEKSLYALDLLGVKLPRKPGRMAIFFAYLKVKMHLIGMRTEDLLNLPPMDNPHKQAVLRILYRMGTPAYYKGAQFLASIALKTVEYSIKYGNTTHAAAVGYATFAIMQCGILGDIKNGYKSGLVALNLQKKFVPNSILPASQYLFANLIQHWKQHLSETLEPIRQAHIVALEIGETEQAGLALYSYNNRLILLGQNLDSVHTEMVNAIQVLQQVGQQIMTFRQRIALQAVTNLRSQHTSAGTFSGTHYNEEEMIHEHLDSGDQTTLFQLNLFKFFQAYLLGDFRAALAAEKQTRQYIHSALSSAFLPLLYCFSSLARLALYRQATVTDQTAFMKTVRCNQKKLKKWATHAPMNFLHLYELVAAEVYRCRGKEEKAEKLYEQAIHNADQNGFVHNKATAYELAGDFYLSRGRKIIGEAYLKQACLCFQQWGAAAKVRQLLQHYPMLVTRDEEIAELASPFEAAAAEKENRPRLSQLDMLTLLKASKVLATEIHSTSYLASMLEIMIENAGAENGILFLLEEDQWRAKVSGRTVMNTIAFTYFSEDEQDPLLPWSIIQYVARTGEKVLLTNAALDNTYARDAYIAAHKSKSILCCPILFRGEIVSILFLENNLMIDAFSRKRVELIEHLGSQASLSLRNARLYTELRDTIDRMQQEIVDHKQTQQQLLHSEKLAAMGKLSASIAHEIGNPLLGVKFLLAEIQKNAILTQKQEKMVQVGLDECLRLQNMIRKLRHLYQTPTYNLEECNFNAIVENTLIFYDKHLRTNNILLEKDLHPALQHVMGVKDQLMQVLTNLILNAVDVMQDGGVLSITTGHCGQDVYFAVGDSGAGISKEKQEKIFEPFYSSKPTVEGAGLGLSVSYGIVAKHEGVLRVDSIPGEGTFFVVSIPQVEQLPIIT